jgi:hypothetical protein
MLNRLRQVLPSLAVVGAVIAAICVVLLSYLRQMALVDTGATRPVVEAALAQLEACHPVSLEDTAFRREVEKLLQTPYVATVWLFSAEGRLVFAKGSTSSATPTGKTAEELASEDTRRVIDALPKEALISEQRAWLLAASAIRREGEHNDIYHHLVIPVWTANDPAPALVGVAYEISQSLDSPIRFHWMIILFGALGGLLLYWMSLPLWVFLSARERGEHAWAWAIFVFFGNLVGLIAYLLARKPQPGIPT